MCGPMVRSASTASNVAPIAQKNDITRIALPRAIVGRYSA